LHRIAVVVVVAAANVETAPQIWAFLCLFTVQGSNFHSVCLFVFSPSDLFLLIFPKVLLIYNVKEFSGMYHLYIHKLLNYYVLGHFRNFVSVCVKETFKVILYK
jgi:hypothetical protein